jgi:hypothetical protein
MQQSRLLYVLTSEPHSLYAVIAGVVICQGDQIEARPYQLTDECGFGAHPSTATLVGRKWLVVVQQDLQIGEGHIGVTYQVDHAQELGLAVGREPAGNDGISSEGHREPRAVCRLTRLS